MFVSQGGQNFMVPSATEKRKVPLYSAEYYGYCTVGGILSCGLTHTAVTPLDVVKCKLSIYQIFRQV
jgi:solute carrier family 25 phosphate transporter 3